MGEERQDSTNSPVSGQLASGGHFGSGRRRLALTGLRCGDSLKRMSSTGEGTGVGFDTMRGRNYPSIRQFTVFLENRIGSLLEVIRRFEGTRVKIVALSIADSAECAFVRFLLSHPEQGREILERAGLAIIESDVIGVELPDDQQPLLRVCTALLQGEVNIIQAYPLLVRPHGRPAVAVMVDNIEMGLEILARAGFNTIGEIDLHDDD